MSKFLKIEGLCKSFQSGSEKLDILVNLALEVEPGQMVAITGASGSGKSTFLHLVGGMDRADSGKILLEGTDVTRLAGIELAQFRNQKIGFVFQFHHLLPEFSALENVMFPLLLRRNSFPQAAEQAKTLLEEVGLSQRIHHKPGELSGGEQQRVAVARALVGKPSLLLGDEPTGNLDEHTAEALYRLLGEIHRRHALTSIIVTHNQRLAAQCEREKRLQEGKLV
ncbi:ABC transporter ATP-binding protein [Acidobacteria bacterium AH-259-D05]|nr:ABC transporter ATP-binding protein [Acidobacteria bacterium AH-259-D05]